jgi:hypothetical protein
VVVLAGVPELSDGGAGHLVIGVHEGQVAAAALRGGGLRGAGGVSGVFGDEVVRPSAAETGLLVGWAKAITGASAAG